MVHPIDKIHLKMALSSIAILAGIVVYSNLFQTPHCWPTQYIEPPYITYIEKTCGNNITRILNGGSDFPQPIYHLALQAAASGAIYLLVSHIASLTRADANILAIAWQQRAGGNIMEDTPIGDRLRQLLSSHMVAVFYFFTQNLVMGLWLTAYYFMPSPPEELNPSPPDSQYWAQRDHVANTNASIFMCQFSISVSGNTYVHETQCEIPSYEGVRFAVMADRLLCLTLACATGLHIIYTFILAPVVQRGNAAIAARAVDVSPSKLGVCFGFSDLYMTTALSDVTHTCVGVQGSMTSSSVYSQPCPPQYAGTQNMQGKEI